MEKGLVIPSKASPSRAHIKRPMNSFMVWSREKRCEILKKHPGINNAVVSKTLGAAWKSLTEEEKKPYVYEAQRLAELHRDEHPEYKYRPRRRKNRMKMNEMNEEPPANYMPQHHPAPTACMCHANPNPPPSSYPRCPATPSQYMYPPFYSCIQPACCSGDRCSGERCSGERSSSERAAHELAAHERAAHERAAHERAAHERAAHLEKASVQEYIEQQELMRLKQAHYSRDLDMRYRDLYKTPCTRGCCSPTEDYYRYYKYTPYPKETLPY